MTGAALSLSATYYCRAGFSRCTRGYPDRPPCLDSQGRNTCPDLYAAISPDLARFRGKYLTVSRGSRSVRVLVIDCNCQTTRGIDLYSDAFARLAPLGLGRITVSVR